MGSAIKRNAEPLKINSWRVAHLGLSLGGVMLFAVAAVLPLTGLSALWAAILATAFIVSTYGFIIALPYGAYVGERGLENVVGKGRIVYVGNIIGAGGSLIGGILLVVGSFMALLI